jgi:hypothetical protein
MLLYGNGVSYGPPRQFLIGKLGDKQRRNGSQMCRYCLGQAGNTSVGERDDHSPSIEAGAGASHLALVDATSRSMRRVMPDRELYAWAASSLMRSSPPA